MARPAEKFPDGEAVPEIGIGRVGRGRLRDDEDEEVEPETNPADPLIPDQIAHAGLKLGAQAAHRDAEGAGQLLRQARPALQVAGEDRIDAAKIGGLGGRIYFFKVGLLGGVGADELRPERLVARGIVGLALLDPAEDLVERRAGDLAAAGRGGLLGRGGEAGPLLRGQGPAERGDGDVPGGGLVAFAGQLGVGKRLDAGGQLLEQKVGGEIEAGAARLQEEPALDLQPDLPVTDGFDREVGLGDRAVAQDALKPLGLEPTPLAD